MLQGTGGEGQEVFLTTGPGHEPRGHPGGHVEWRDEVVVPSMLQPVREAGLQGAGGAAVSSGRAGARGQAVLWARRGSHEVFRQRDMI